MAFAMYVTSPKKPMAASLLCLRPIDVPWSLNNGMDRWIEPKDAGTL